MVGTLDTTRIPLPRLPQTPNDWSQLQFFWQQLVEFLEEAGLYSGGIGEALNDVGFLAASAEPSFPASRTIAPVAGELTGADGGVGGAYDIGLADSGVVAGPYGDASHYAAIEVDSKGRVISATEYPSSGGTSGSVEIDFGSTPTDGGTVTVIDPAVTLSTLPQAWIVASDTTTNNDASAHGVAAASFRLLVSAALGSLVIEAHNLFGLATGKFKVRYSYQ